MELITTPEQQIAMTTADKVVEKFLSVQDVKHSSRALYGRTLKQYFKWIESRGYSITEIEQQHLLEYKDSLLAAGMSTLTVASYINSVRSFYRWAEGNKYYPNVAKGLKSPKRKQRFRKQPLQPAQATDLLNHYQGKDIRDYAIVSLLLRTGLRTVEVIRANVEDITFRGSQRVLMVQGKGSYEKDDFVILTDKAYQPIADYLATRGKVNSSEPLFTSTSNNSKGQRLTTRTISWIAKEGLKAIGLDERAFTAHSLRHTAGTSMLKAGASLEYVQYSLRHSNPATTQLYVHTTKDDSRIEYMAESLIDALY